MNRSGFSWDAFHRVPVVGIIRGLTFDEIKEILPVYVSSGLTTIEITMNTIAAKEIISYAAANYSGRLNVGAGTVCDERGLEDALSAGAQFIVTPILNDAVIKSCVDQNVPIFPGAYTPTEIYRAWELGASMVKVYPATSLGSGYIKDVKAPLNHIKLMPTGGIHKDNIAEFMQAGADGLGVGSQLFDKKLIKDKDWSGLEEHFRTFAEYFKS
ncbi:bifunctional 4-hydroxy-2-oxoglutarate aldolase/2-dehydro-3-deoxy-phosphogluconate aldolase [Daejeonella sp.]|uniref:bifunctional 4-hydroxy-2-oxoglutarate aldolase/2-dehydro-3-deoxy-phosphogluconate aldolase n=1 Tax=Daejeonella sp. TaxID=2805397 RepID=UPI0030C33FD1